MNASFQKTATDEFLTDDASILRYRRAILRLSEAMVCAADQRVDLSPLLLEALSSALENLLLYGDVRALESLEEWLDDGETVLDAPRPAPRVALVENNSALLSGRRADAERRATDDRRQQHDRRLTPQGEVAQGEVAQGEVAQGEVAQGEVAIERERRFGTRRIEHRRAPRDRRS